MTAFENFSVLSPNTAGDRQNDRSARIDKVIEMTLLTLAIVECMDETGAKGTPMRLLAALIDFLE
jgi:hypothetical protein